MFMVGDYVISNETPADPGIIYCVQNVIKRGKKWDSKQRKIKKNVTILTVRAVLVLGENKKRNIIKRAGHHCTRIDPVIFGKMYNDFNNFTKAITAHLTVQDEDKNDSSR